MYGDMTEIGQQTEVVLPCFNFVFHNSTQVTRKNTIPPVK
jgi:hypothetical protein